MPSQYVPAGTFLAIYVMALPCSHYMVAYKLQVRFILPEDRQSELWP